MSSQEARTCGVNTVSGSRRGLDKAMLAGGAVASLGLAGLRSPAVAAAGSCVGLVPRHRRAQGVSDAPWVASHGPDSDANEAELDRLVAEGFRLRRISGYSIDNIAFFASIWEQSSGPGWAGRHGLSDAEVERPAAVLQGRTIDL